jgi:hypothetical protein
MPTVSNNTTVTTAPLIPLKISIKQNWDDDWLVLPHAYPTECGVGVSPAIDTAEFIYEFGQIKQNNRSTINLYTPLDLKKWYVRISYTYPNSPTVHAWYGVITNATTIMMNGTGDLGTQKFQCHELTYLLDRTKLTKVYAEQTTSEGHGFATLDVIPTFNLRNQTGGTVFGNRNFAPDDDESEQDEEGNYTKAIYNFSRNGHLWNYRQILDMVLHYGNQTGIPFTLAGQLEPLEDITNVFTIGTDSLWDVMNRLIDRRRSLCFFCEVIETEQGDEVFLRVFSTADQTIKIGNVEIPANKQKIRFVYPTSNPYSHIADNLNFTDSATSQYDRIEVLGAPIKLCLTFALKDGTLVKSGWSEGGYRSPVDFSAANNPDACDAARASPVFDDTYCKYIVPKDWDWRIGGSFTSGGARNNVCPIPQDDGSVSFDEDDLPDGSRYNWNAGKHFLRNLPWPVGSTPTGKTPPSTDADGEDVDFQLMFAFIQDWQDGDQHTATGGYLRLDKLHNASKDLKNIGLSALDNMLGIQLKAEPNHLLALKHWEAADKPEGEEGENWSGAYATNTKPELNYEYIGVTGFFQTDACTKVIVQLRPDTGKEPLRIPVPHCEYHYVAPSTVTGIGPHNAPVQPEEGFVQRDDTELLRTIAALAAAYYKQDRQAIEIPIKSIGLYVPLGAYITDITTATFRKPIATYVSRRHINFETGVTTISTAHSELDFSSLGKKGQT